MSGIPGDSKDDLDCKSYDRKRRQGARSRCFDTAIMLGAYIFDCAKHGAVFDRQLIKSMSLAGKAVFVWEQSLKSSVRSV